MPQFYFHLATPQGRETDETGTLHPSMEHAMVEGWRAMIDITRDLLRDHRSPKGYRFDVADADGHDVFVLCFEDLLSPPVHRPTAEIALTYDRITETLERSHALRSEMAVAVADVRDTLRQTCAILARCRTSDRNIG